MALAAARQVSGHMGNRIRATGVAEDAGVSQDAPPGEDHAPARPAAHGLRARHGLCVLSWWGDVTGSASCNGASSDALLGTASATSLNWIVDTETARTR